MIKTILLWIFWLLIISLIAYWVWTGGFSQLMNTFRSPTSSYFQLPWQPTISTISSTPSAPANTGTTETSNLQTQYATLENNYEQMNAQDTQAKVFGDPSPLRGRVRIADANGAMETEAVREYIVLTAGTENTAPVDIKGWSLQSAYTGVRVYIPLGAPAFLMGVVNDQEDVLLNHGAFAIVSSGSSPVGSSFRENICSGYLGQLQNFFPPLSNSCPRASSALPFTPDNLKIYGDTCFSFLQNISSCTAPLENIPADVNPNCRAFAANVLSYNGCVTSNRYRPVFNLDSWRVYLGSNTELWSNTHDIIRLLDSEGRTVDVLTY